MKFPSFTETILGFRQTHPCRLHCTYVSLISLTGLLSFMLSDEMTTGSVTSTDAHKRALATKSHAWNIAHQRFRDAFPEVRVHLVAPPNTELLLINLTLSVLHTNNARSSKHGGEGARKAGCNINSDPITPSAPFPNLPVFTV